MNIHHQGYMLASVDVNFFVYAKVRGEIHAYEICGSGNT